MKRILLLLVSFLLFGFCPISLKEKALETPISYEQVEIKPIFPGGISEFMKYVIGKYKIPEEDEEGYGVTGVLQASIVIESDGTVSQVGILKDVGTAGKQIKNILYNSPKWSPGKNKGVAVPVIYNFTVTIK